MEGRFKRVAWQTLEADYKDKYSTALYRSSIVRSGSWSAGEEWGKMKKTGSRNVGRENGGCFSCSYDRVGRAGKLFVFLYSVKGIWLIF